VIAMRNVSNNRLLSLRGQMTDKEILTHWLFVLDQPDYQHAYDYVRLVIAARPAPVFVR